MTREEMLGQLLWRRRGHLALPHPDRPDGLPPAPPHTPPHRPPAQDPQHDGAVLSPHCGLSDVPRLTQLVVLTLVAQAASVFTRYAGPALTRETFTECFPVISLHCPAPGAAARRILIINNWLRPARKYHNYRDLALNSIKHTDHCLCCISVTVHLWEIPVTFVIQGSQEL